MSWEYFEYILAILVVVFSSGDLIPNRRQTIAWTNADLSWI